MRLMVKTLACSSLVVVAAAVSGCAKDAVDVLPEFEPGTTSGIGDGGESGPTQMADESSGGSTEETGEPGVPSVACGNGIIDGDDVCDGMDLGGETCVGLGFEKGELGCTANCGGLVLDGCGWFECGNGEPEGDEDCDGTVGKATCADVGFDNGTLFCTMDCEYNDEMCGICGDGDLDPAEDCEEKLGLRETCESLDFDAGELACGRDCLYDTSGCQLCGNGTAEGTETCDGDDLTGATCASLGLEGGELSCTDACTFDFSACDLTGTPFGDDGFYLGLSLQSGVVACDDISATGTDLGLSDDGTGVANIGFDFPFYETVFTQVVIGANGTLNFGAGANPSYTNECSPYSGTGSANLLKPFWDDLNPSLDTGAVRYETLGAPGSQRFVVHWDVSFYLPDDATNHVDFRVVLHEASQAIDVCYVDTQGATTEPGNSGLEATSGIQRDSATGIEFSCNAATLVDGLQLTYLPQ